MVVYFVSVDVDAWANDESLLAARTDLEKTLATRGLARYEGWWRTVAAEDGLRPWCRVIGLVPE
jgi:hypothetical protein